MRAGPALLQGGGVALMFGGLAGQSHRKPAAADCDLLNASLKASCSPQEKPHASTVDRRVSLMDSLIVEIEMVARTNGMGLARIETVSGNQLDG